MLRARRLPRADARTSGSCVGFSAFPQFQFSQLGQTCRTCETNSYCVSYFVVYRFTYAYVTRLTLRCCVARAYAVFAQCASCGQWQAAASNMPILMVNINNSNASTSSSPTPTPTSATRFLLLVHFALLLLLSSSSCPAICLCNLFTHFEILRSFLFTLYTLLPPSS